MTEAATFMAIDKYLLVKKLMNKKNENIISEKIEKGLANVGIFKHSTSKSENEGADLSIIEKRTRSKSEMSVALSIMAGTYLEERIELFPQVYGVEKINDDVVAIYMEYLYGAGTLPLFNKELACQITSGVSGLNKLNLLLAERKKKESLANYYCKKLEGVLPEKIIKENVYNDLLSSRVVLSHNDLYWSNMAININSDSPIRFLDFGSVRENFIGADFHHFARSATLNPIDEDIYEKIVCTYSNSQEVDVSCVKKNSIIYALIRCSNRVEHYMSKGNKSKSAKEEVVKKDLAESYTSLL